MSAHRAARPTSTGSRLPLSRQCPATDRRGGLVWTTRPPLPSLALEGFVARALELALRSRSRARVEVAGRTLVRQLLGSTPQRHHQIDIFCHHLEVALLALDDDLEQSRRLLGPVFHDHLLDAEAEDVVAILEGPLGAGAVDPPARDRPARRGAGRHEARNQRCSAGRSEDLEGEAVGDQIDRRRQGGQNELALDRQPLVPGRVVVARDPHLGLVDRDARATARCPRRWGIAGRRRRSRRRGRGARGRCGRGERRRRGTRRRRRWGERP